MLIPALALLGVSNAQTCSNYGTASDSACLCPPGFNPPGTSNDCNLPVCGGSLYSPTSIAPPGTASLGNISAGSCACDSGWQGPGCTGEAPTFTGVAAIELNFVPSLHLRIGMFVVVVKALYGRDLDGPEYDHDVLERSRNLCLLPAFLLRRPAPVAKRVPARLDPHHHADAQWITHARRTKYAYFRGIDRRRRSGLCAAVVRWYRAVLLFRQWVQSDSRHSSGKRREREWIHMDVSDAGMHLPERNHVLRSDQCKSTVSVSCGKLTVIQALDLTPVINGLGGPLTIDCSPLGTCAFQQAKLETLFGSRGLQLTSCSFGECVEQYVIDAAVGVAAAPTSTALSGGVIAGLVVVGVLLLAAIVLVAWGWWQQKRARRGLKADGALPPSGGVGITWSSVGYEVNPRSRPGASLYRWVKGAGAGGTEIMNEKGDNVGRNGGKVVLRDVCGQLPPGGFCCILGPSGAGKSTLVDILAGKRKAGKVEGRVAFVDDREVRAKIRVGYVDQSDVLSPTATVLETLIFAAHLRLPENIPTSIKVERAATVLAQLGLSDIAHTRVGSIDRRGISGGEMRRVSIGIELVAAPDILVLDEPTSGLDSVSASRLIKLLKSLTTENETTIIASIHQPSSALYKAFDQVVLLAHGKQLYFGKGGSAPVEYFERQNRFCPDNYNVADHLLEIASASLEGLATGSQAVGEGYDSRGGSRDSNDNDEIANGLGSSSTNVLVESPMAEKNAYPPMAPTLLNKREISLADFTHKTTTECATAFLTQLEGLSGREWRNLKRDKTLLVAHLFLSCLIGVFAGGLYFKVGLTIAGFQNRVGSLFFLGSLIAFSSLSALYNLVEVRSLFLRERAAGFYSPNAWLLSRVLFDVIPLRLIPTILVGIIVYFMVGLSHQPARFFKFLLILVEYSMGMTLFNFLLACVFRHGGIAILLSSLCNLFLMTYAGFFVNLSQIPPVLRWLRYFSTLGYTLEALSINEVGSGLQIIDTLDGVAIEINAVVIMQTLFGFDLGNYYRDVLVLFAFIAGFAVLLVGVVIFVLREKR
ncbi:hypothetical protein P7C73_g5437, partial [Tremellales sp. Uapishka_1]